MPHLLVAGATGSGKSVMLHSLILSLLYKNSPETLRMVMIDPKRVELTIYNGLPHLVSPVVTDGKKTISVFRWAISEMDRRYGMLESAGNRDIKSYNTAHKKEPLPYVAIVIDELADLMAAYGREIEGSIVRLAQMARATGIHLVVATQRPSVEVITGLIKANITSRVALQVASQIDSRTILDSAGAEKLLGGGDMLFSTAELSKPRRIQGAFVGEEEIRAVADFIRDKNEELDTAEVEFPEKGGESKDLFEAFAAENSGEEDEDEMFDEAVSLVRQAQKASASLLQRRLKVGYARAARLLDIMESRGIIGPGEGAKPREVFITNEEEA
jgi:DNA segregation ATPase FtsK/SpoIIIE, S-DNA-T family